MKVNIYFVWVGDKEMPKFNKNCIKTWRLIKNCNIIKIGNECKSINSRFLQWAFENKNYACASNYMRLYALYKKGGIYMDTDVEVIKDSDIWRSDCFVIGKEMPEWINNNLMISHRKGHKLLKIMIEKLDNWDFNNIKEIEVETSVRLVTRCIQEFGYILNDNKKIDIIGNIQIYPEKVFSPKRFYEKFDHNCIKPETLAVHHFTKLW